VGANCPIPRRSPTQLNGRILGFRKRGGNTFAIDGEFRMCKYYNGKSVSFLASRRAARTPQRIPNARDCITVACAVDSIGEERQRGVAAIICRIGIDASFPRIHYPTTRRIYWADVLQRIPMGPRPWR